MRCADVARSDRAGSSTGLSEERDGTAARRTDDGAHGRLPSPSLGGSTPVRIDGQLDDEPGALCAVGAVLDPHPSAVQVHVLGDEGQTEADAASPPRRPPRRRGRSVEDHAALVGGTPGPLSSTAICIDVAEVGDLDRRWRRRRTSRRCRGGCAMHPGQAALVGLDTQSRHRGVDTSIGIGLGAGTGTACRTNSTRLSSSRSSRAVPTSKREISSRSSTSCLNRSTSADEQVDRGLRRGRAARRVRVSSTSTDAASVISGDRSSWLTSDAKRASRSTRSCSAPAISLNEAASEARSRSAGGTRRVSRRPPAMASAAADDLGERAQRAAAGPDAEDGAERRW